MKNKKIKLALLLVILISLTGCTKILQTEEKKPVKNELTGQNLVQNILCKPEDTTTIELYKSKNMIPCTGCRYCEGCQTPFCQI